MKQPAGFLFAMIDDMHTTVRIYMQAAEGSWPVVPITFPTISVCRLPSGRSVGLGSALIGQTAQRASNRQPCNPTLGPAT